MMFGIEKEMLIEGVISQLEFLQDIISGIAFGDLDDTPNGIEGKKAGLATIEMLKGALLALKGTCGTDKDADEGSEKGGAK